MGYSLHFLLKTQWQNLQSVLLRSSRHNPRKLQKLVKSGEKVKTTRPNWAKQLPAKKACARTQSCKSCKAKAQTCHHKKKKSFRGLLLTAAATPAVIITTDRLKKCYDTP